jgi:hypothetical protein
MWLINTTTLKLEEFFGDLIPPYAILSHAWEGDEVSFDDMSRMPSAEVKAKKGYPKIEQTCRIALQESLGYAWVDTCCINKSSSAELTEAINSMYEWYERSAICYAFLSDLNPSVTKDEGFPACRWFTRGWTLQELIAPAQVVFYDSNWNRRGTKHSVAYLVSQITRIQSDYLWRGNTIKFASVAEKMSWASRRTTTRIEDMAYCLLGLFDISMPMLYGEGERAFLRLQEEIIKKTNDLSLFAWTAPSLGNHCCGVLAPRPAMFKSSGALVKGARDSEFSVTNKGIRITTRLERAPAATNDHPHFLLYLGYDSNFRAVYLVLQKYGADQFVRDNKVASGIWIPMEPLTRQFLATETFYLTHDPEFMIAQEEIYQIRQRAVRLELNDGLKVFEVTPSGLWDPIHSLLHDPTASVAVNIGFSSSPYGSVVILSLGGRTADDVYVLPTSSPALSYIFKNISNLTSEELERYFALRPTKLVGEPLPPSGERRTVEARCDDLAVWLAVSCNQVIAPILGDGIFAGPMGAERLRWQLRSLNVYSIHRH